MTVTNNFFNILLPPMKKVVKVSIHCFVWKSEKFQNCEKGVIIV